MLLIKLTSHLVSSLDRFLKNLPDFSWIQSYKVDRFGHQMRCHSMYQPVQGIGNRGCHPPGSVRPQITETSCRCCEVPTFVGMPKQNPADNLPRLVLLCVAPPPVAGRLGQELRDWKDTDILDTGRNAMSNMWQGSWCQQAYA